MVRRSSVALLAVGSYNNQPGTINPSAPDPGHWLYDFNQTLYVFKSEKGGLRVGASSGLPTAEYPESMPVGTSTWAHADQTGKSLGVLTVVGIAYIAKDGTVTTVGEVPSKKLKWSVFK